jgi:fumarate hydratase class I
VATSRSADRRVRRTFGWWATEKAAPAGRVVGKSRSEPGRAPKEAHEEVGFAFHAHMRLKERLDRGEELPGYFRNHIIYYAGPAKTPPGGASGSFGPTTAGRMDPYVPLFQERGASLVMLAKGNRSPVVKESCKKFGGFYLGSIGGPAARLAKECITSMEVLDYPELGMEAIFMITVKDFPAFVITDDKGNDFFDKLLG